MCTEIAIPHMGIKDILCKELFLNESSVVHQPTFCALYVFFKNREMLPMDGHVWMGVINCEHRRRKWSTEFVKVPEHCPSLTSHLGSRPWNWELWRQKILQLLAPKGHAAMLLSHCKRGPSSSEREGK